MHSFVRFVYYTLNFIPVPVIELFYCQIFKSRILFLKASVFLYCFKIGICKLFFKLCKDSFRLPVCFGKIFILKNTVKKLNIKVKGFNFKALSFYLSRKKRNGKMR